MRLPLGNLISSGRAACPEALGVKGRNATTQNVRHQPITVRDVTITPIWKCYPLVGVDWRIFSSPHPDWVGCPFEFDQNSYLIAPLLVLGFSLSPKKLPNRGSVFLFAALLPPDSAR